MKYDYGVVIGKTFLLCFDGKRGGKRRRLDLERGSFDGRSGDVPLDDLRYCLRLCGDVDGRGEEDEAGYSGLVPSLKVF